MDAVVAKGLADGMPKAKRRFGGAAGCDCIVPAAAPALYD
jgi:hypothetical protein